MVDDVDGTALGVPVVDDVDGTALGADVADDAVGTSVGTSVDTSVGTAVVGTGAVGGAVGTTVDVSAVGTGVDGTAASVSRTGRTKLRIRTTSPCGPLPVGQSAGLPDFGSLRWAPAPCTSISWRRPELGGISM